MTKSHDSIHRSRLVDLRVKLLDWVTQAAYPLWEKNGIDARNGGFVEILGEDGVGLPHPRRARVHPRQIYAFAQAPMLGWNADVGRIVTRGTDYFTKHYLRADGLFRTLADVDGKPLDDRAVLYDQAFALLGYAAAGAALGEVEPFEVRALALRQAIERRFRTSDGAFRSDENPDGLLESNPHMHLLEACLAWAEIGSDRLWEDWVQRLVDVALHRFIRSDTGAVGESFTSQWKPAPGLAGRVVEPGHQFEWAWLLMRSARHHPGVERKAALQEAALRLIGIGEKSGVHNGIAVNALLDDFSIHDPKARFWPQTERLKAGLLAAEVTGEERYWEMAAAAAASMLPYLDTPLAGLWRDVRLPSGEILDAPAPASTFYHVIGAIVALEKALAVR